MKLYAVGVLSIACVVGDPAFACDDTEVQYDASRLVIAGGSITEIIYELGLEGQIVGADRTSNYPLAALELPQVGYVRNLSAEGLLGLQPTLILGEDDMGPEAVVSQIQAAGIDIVRIPEAHSINGVLEKTACVARLAGAEGGAYRTLRDRLDGAAARLQKVARDGAPRVALLLNLTDGVPTAGGSDTSADGLLQMAGGRNVFTEFDGWKPVSLEAMARSDPEFVVMPLRGVEAAGGIDAVVAHPSLRLTTAGRNRAVIAIDGMAMLGFGPRTLGVAVSLAETFGTLESGAGE